QVAVAPDGALYVAYEGSDPATGYATDQLVVARSTNGGTSFLNSQVARVWDDLDCYPLQLPGAQGRQTLTNEQFRINSFPSMSIDPTTGGIAIVWADDQGAGNCGSGSATFSGDYTGTAVGADGKAVTVWTDFRGNPGLTPANQDALVGTGF